MKYLITILTIFLSLHGAVYSQGQSPLAKTDYYNLYKNAIAEYGFDQVLVNGTFFEDKYKKKIGHQFLLEDILYKGNLTFRGKEYKNVEMKYDIYDNQIILCVKNNISVAWVVPPNDFISGFSFGGKSFSKYNIQGRPEFYQVVYDAEKLKCLYYWHKKMHETYDNKKYITYEFFKSEKKCFLILNDSLLTYRNNGSFMDILPEEIRERVKKYIKANHIKVNKSNDDKILELLSYCKSLF